MKLETFEKVRVSCVTEYSVFSGDNFIEKFVVDYGVKNENGFFDTVEMGKAISKRMSYEKSGANVRFVCVNSATGNLDVTIEI